MNPNQLNDQNVLVRVDFNVPIEKGKVLSTQRIDATIPILKQLLAQKNSIIIATHLGRPKGVDPHLSTLILKPLLEERLQTSIHWEGTWPQDNIQFQKGQVYLVDNLRFNPEETDCDQEWVKKTLRNIDSVVMDAFSCAHRDHASIKGWIDHAPVILPGPLFEKEVAVLKKVLHQSSSVMAIVGGSKVSTKTSLLMTLLSKVDTLVLGGGIANTFLKAQGLNIGRSLVDDDWVDFSKEMLVRAEALDKTIILPMDVIILDSHGECRSVDLVEVTDDDCIFDVGNETMKVVQESFNKTDTILWNGPLGRYEDPRFNQSTEFLGKALKDYKGWSVAGGGDTIAALESLNLLESVDYASMAGGAFLSYIENDGLTNVNSLYERINV